MSQDISVKRVPPRTFLRLNPKKMPAMVEQERIGLPSLQQEPKCLFVEVVFLEDPFCVFYVCAGACSKEAFLGTSHDPWKHRKTVRN